MRQNMNWKKPFLIGAVFAAVLFSFGCPTGTKPEDVVKEEPKLELKSLKVEGADVNLKNPEVEITTTKNKVDKVEAEFNINVDKSEVKIDSHTLKENQFVDVKLSVEAKKGKYQAFDFTVKVKKLKKAEPEPDPKLTLASLRIHGKDAKSGSCEVENTVTTVVATDVTATFTYGKVKTPEEIPVTVANGTLNEGANIVKLHVPAVPGKYKEWSLDINVTRKAPELLPPVLKSVRVFDKFVIFEDNDPTKAGSVDVPNSKTTLTAGDIKAYFTWQGNTSAERIPVTVTGAPVALTTEYQDITFKVAESAGKYKAFEKTIKVKRIALELKKIKVHAANFDKLEIKDISNPAHEARSTYLPKVNVFFYSDVNAPQEDTELVDIITTEPELEKTNSAGGIIKTWKLTQAGENTLKVKVNGELKYTVKVTRTPIKIDSVNVGNHWSLREGQSYEVAQDSPELLVTPARGAVCKGVSVTVGGGAPQTLVYDNVTGGYYKNLEGLDGTEKEVVITVEDPDNAEFNGIFKFKLKTTFDPMTAPIDPAVAVNKIWFGADPMDTVNVNKFEAAKSSDHEYTVTVDKNWKSSSSPLIWMIVEGGDNAKTADISAEEGAVSVKADGAAIFKSVKKYFDIRAGGNIYVFKLTNGDKEALYKVTVKFEFEHKYTITVTQPDPAQGEIKAWRAKGGAREDIDLAASSNVIQEAKGKTLYFELIAKDGYKPVKLTVDTTEVTGAAIVPLQTAGAIAYAYKVADKAVTVTGELAAKAPALENVTFEPVVTEDNVGGDKNKHKRTFTVKYPEFEVPADTKYVDARIRLADGKAFPKGTKLEVKYNYAAKGGDFGGAWLIEKEYTVSQADVKTLFGSKLMEQDNRTPLRAGHVGAKEKFEVTITVPEGAEASKVVLESCVFASQKAENVDEEPLKVLGSSETGVPGYVLTKLTSFDKTEVTQVDTGANKNKYTVTLTAKYPKFDTSKTEDVGNVKAISPVQYIDSIITMKDGGNLPKDTKITVVYKLGEAALPAVEYTVGDNAEKIFGKDIFTNQGGKHIPLNVNHSGAVEKFEITVEVPATATEQTVIKVVSALFAADTDTDASSVLGEIGEITIPAYIN